MTRYRSNEPRFVDESVDGEALIMDMVSGTYYTCLGASTVAWEALKRGSEPAEVTAMIASAYRVDEADVERDLAGFVAELVQEQMLVERGDVPSTLIDRPDGDGAPASSPPGTYEPMHLERYDDLADLILLDPVQDVSGGARPPE